jgi:hypothetical protein
VDAWEIAISTTRLSECFREKASSETNQRPRQLAVVRALQKGHDWTPWCLDILMPQALGFGVSPVRICLEGLLDRLAEA